MANSVVVVVSGDDKTGEVFNAVKKHLDETKAKAKETSDSLGQMGEFLKRGLETAGIAVGVREIVNGFQEMISKSMELGVEIGHLHQQTGISTENLSTLKYMSDETGVSFEALTKGFKKLSTEIFNGNTKAFNALGLSLEEVKAKGQDMYGIMAMVADRFKTMPDGPTKMAIATELFGRAGQQLIPILDQGSAAIENFRGQAESLGLVLDEQGVKKLEEMHKQTEHLKGAIEGLGLAFTEALAPAIDAAIPKLEQFLGIGGQGPHGNDMKAGLAAIHDFFVNTFQTLPGAVDIAGQQRAAEAMEKLKEKADDQKRKDDKKNPPPSPPTTAPKNGIVIDTSDAELAQLERDHAYDQFLREQKESLEAAKPINMPDQGAPDLSVFQNSPLVGMGPQEKDYTDIRNFAEKYAHGLFDPLMDMSARWDQRWKQMRNNLLRDLGQTVESQLFGVLFGDPQGRGGRGWNGGSWEHNPNMPGRTGLASGALGELMGWFHRGAKVASNGGVGSGAGTLPTAAASLMQLGRSSGSGGVQVVLNNNGAPLEVGQTQQQNDGGEGHVIQIMLKQLETNGPVAQGIMGLLGVL